MPAVQTTYATAMQPGAEGQIATQLNDDNSETRINETVAGIAFGRAVSEGVNARGCVLGGATKFIGITVKSTTEIPLTGQTVDMYQYRFNVGVMLAGDIWVRAVAEAVHGNTAFYDETTGQIQPASGGTEILTSRWMTDADAGELALLRLTTAAPGAPD